MTSTTPPATRQASRSTYLDVRGLRYHVREWGEPGAPILFLFHGWMDVSASFQFLVDALRERWHIVAPDWRGYGESARPTDGPGVECYWFADYLADLEAIVDHYQPEGQVTLVGHSLGANVVCLYAGIRPERVRRVVDLEGFGMTASKASQAPRRYARWLDELKDKPRLNTYATVEDVAARLQKTNPRLPADKAAFLAQHWSHQGADGRWEILGDPAHKIINPQLYRLDEVMEVWRRVTAPVLHVEAVDSPTLKAIAGEMPLPEFKKRFAAFPDFREVLIADAGHMLHHDQPEQVAMLIEEFCRHA
ncbi:alpha/beta hydrolase [Ralstonia insidiosa]|uniref:alpha/beta fold hydrolase n=1 Tax=Ralstonia TaxID=48736 RepID=UPI000664C2C0|nr:alpha/beta hydrolase [Ralstonia insidiosa]KMW46308.1 alpha/beta hydrolase [Ralstonia sp. MD27]MBX3775376.1 alpha/beta hydrolase [Ralstonia pickettii]NOZ17744.1 alpha/beta hydrolase [Betaproteobacteria bacterium]MBA9873107.1 alpha/beta hydrolase [Ralstonia insidiosa]MBA9916103.1 alpha/beta hydrolase [Ralstonia insidiosa]